MTVVKKKLCVILLIALVIMFSLIYIPNAKAEVEGEHEAVPQFTVNDGLSIWSTSTGVANEYDIHVTIDINSKIGMYTGDDVVLIDWVSGATIIDQFPNDNSKTVNCKNSWYGKKMNGTTVSKTEDNIGAIALMNSRYIAFKLELKTTFSPNGFLRYDVQRNVLEASFRIRKETSAPISLNGRYYHQTVSFNFNSGSINVTELSVELKADVGTKYVLKNSNFLEIK